MNKRLFAALIILLSLSGCVKVVPSSGTGGQESSPLMSVLSESPEAETGKTTKSELENLPSNETSNDGENNPNPYKDYSERRDYWRYDLYEVFHGAEMVEFKNTLNYVQEYNHTIPPDEYGWPDTPHEYSCNIKLPQTTGNAPWPEQINAYYENILPDCIAEGEAVWNENIDDWYVRGFGYDYEGAYKFENVLTVVRSSDFHGYRTTLGLEPFADMFSALDGKKLCLDDLFCVSREEYLPVVQSSLQNATLRFTRDYDPAYDEEFRAGGRMITRFDEASIAVAPVGLVFIYPTGVAGPIYVGTEFLCVPYEDLQGILNPVYFPDYTTEFG